MRIIVKAITYVVALYELSSEISFSNLFFAETSKVDPEMVWVWPEKACHFLVIVIIP